MLINAERPLVVSLLPQIATTIGGSALRSSLLRLEFLVLSLRLENKLKLRRQLVRLEPELVALLGRGEVLQLSPLL